MAELKTSKASLPDFFEMVSSAPYMMRSATDFLPRVIRTFMNLATSSLLNLGSGRISRLGISLRRGMWCSPTEWGNQETALGRGTFGQPSGVGLRRLGTLGAVLGA